MADGYRYFASWRDDGTVDVVHDTFRDEVRTRSKKRAGGTRNVTPSAGIVDSRSLRGADTVRAETRGYGTGRETAGRTRHIVTDTLGLLLVVMVTAASVQDHDGGAEIRRVHELVPSLRHVFADSGYAGKLVAKAMRYWKLSVEVVSKPAWPT